MKKILLYIAAVMIILSFSGCNDNTAFVADSTPESETEPVVSVTEPENVISLGTGNADQFPNEPEVVVLPTAPDTDPNEYAYKPADVPQQYWAVLNNAQMIHFPGYSHQENLYLDDYAFPHTSNVVECLKYLEYVQYAVVTNANGNVMLAIKGTYGTLILYEEDGVVYGLSRTVKNMYLLFDDGSNCWTDTNEYGRSWLSFENGKFTHIDLYRIDRVLDKYYVEGKEVTYDELLAYQETINSTEIAWSDLIRYPLAKAPPKGG